MRKVGLYLRVSTQEQAERGWSIKGQYTELRKFCEAREGWKVIRVLKDAGYTAANLERPGIQQLLDLVQARDLDVVVVWRYDRLSRDNLDFPLLLHLFRKNDVELVSSTEPAPGTDTPYGEFVVGMIGLIATLERKMNAMRVRMGLRARTRKGMWHGGPVPYGCRYERTLGKLVPEPAEAATVRRIFGLYAATGRLHIVKANLRQEGLADRKGKSWTLPAIRNILRRRTYTGRLSCGGVDIEDSNLAFADAELFERCQVLLDEERSRSEDEVPSTTIEHVHLNKEGLPACPQCGSHQAVRRKRIKLLADRTQCRKYWCRLCAREFDAITALEPRPACPACGPGGKVQPSRSRTTSSGIRYRPYTCVTCGTRFRTILDPRNDRELSTGELRGSFGLPRLVETATVNLWR